MYINPQVYLNLSYRIVLFFTRALLLLDSFSSIYLFVSYLLSCPLLT